MGAAACDGDQMGPGPPEAVSNCSLPEDEDWSSLLV